MTIINTANIGSKAITSNKAANISTSSSTSFASLVSSTATSSIPANVANINGPNNIHLTLVNPDEQSKQQCRELLSHLQRLKLRLIHGQLDNVELEELSLALESVIIPNAPSVRHIIAEIRTRVAVELAKYNKA